MKNNILKKVFEGIKKLILRHKVVVFLDKGDTLVLRIDKPTVIVKGEESR